MMLSKKQIPKNDVIYKSVISDISFCSDAILELAISYFFFVDFTLDPNFRSALEPYLPKAY